MRSRSGKPGEESISDAVRRSAIDVISQPRRFDLEGCGATRGVASAFIAAEEKGFIFEDRPAHISAELIEDQWRPVVGDACRKKVASVERRIAMEFPQATVKLIRSGLRSQVDDGSVAAPKLAGKIVGLHLRLFDGFDTRHDRRFAGIVRVGVHL